MPPSPMLRRIHRTILLVLLFCPWLPHSTAQNTSGSWNGVLRDGTGHPISQATIQLRSASHEYSASTSLNGEFAFTDLSPGKFRLSVISSGKTFSLATLVTLNAGATLHDDLELSTSQELRLLTSEGTASAQASGGEHLSSGEVSSLPLNERDFSKLLLLAAGTMTDANGAANFTQQFAVNGQRGNATVFAMDSADTTDPEMGGATFSNFNVDAIQEVQSSSGVMPAEIGHGAAGYTNVVTKSGTNFVHGSFFEFVRNAAFDARNYFDHKDSTDTRRIPPFARNEFGFTNGGPVVIPRIYNGRGRTYYFGEYQGFRQVLGTTQVFPVPTAAERQGIDTTAFPGDTLTVPASAISAAIAPIVSGYPLPNNPAGAYGARTYEASAKIYTNTNQFSIRLDHRISDKASLMTRFSLNQITGPETNPDQIALDPSFAIRFFDHQRNAAVKYSRTISPRLISETTLGYARSTPFFPAGNHVQPGIGFGDGLFAGFNTPAGSIFGSFGNLYQFKHDMSFTGKAHTLKWGVETRYNRDATIFGTAPNGAYSFGGGTAYSPVFIPSASGQHDIQPGDPLPDSLLGLLTGTPYSYSASLLASVTPGGDRFNEAAVQREAYNFYFQDSWKIRANLTLNYGLRYEVNSRIHEAHQRTSTPKFVDSSGKDVPYWDRNATQIFLYNPQPPYDQDWTGWGPRLSLDYRIGKNTVIHAGGAVTPLLPNLWQDNFITGGVPLIFNTLANAAPGAPIPFQNSLPSTTLPPAYTTSGQLLFPNGTSDGVAANTPVDLERFQQDLAALTPNNQLQLVTLSGIAKNFRNGYIGSYSLGLEHDFGDVKFDAAYVATSGIHLTCVYSPNGYGGASPGFAPFTRFDSFGNAIGGLGPENIVTSSSHSTYHALQTGLGKNSARLGLGFQASYTFSKSLDDTSSVLGGLFGNSGVILQTLPQDPFNPRAEKGPSTFDVAHVFTVSAIQMLPLERVRFLRPLGRTLTRGWQVLNITTLTTGSPFSVYSGVQQTGAGAGGTDRPDLVSQPHFSTSRTVRQDYFGRGEDNASFFNIPINVPGGTGPNHGHFGTLGRNTFRGPGFHNYDLALIKDTPFGHRGSGELGIIQFRAEFFNVFNVVNFGLPSNIVRGSGFGFISKTAGPSRQIQFSLKIMY